MSALADVMVDLETFGTRPGAMIRAIGAVKFSVEGGIEGTFYERIDPRSCERHGLKLDVDTFEWWLKQDEAARLEVTAPGKELPVVLQGFAAWLEPVKGRKVWGNGAGFDNVLLAEAYHACLLPVPWGAFDNRCYRTVKGLYPEVAFVKPTGRHQALEDAKAQAEHLIRMLGTTKAPRHEGEGMGQTTKAPRHEGEGMGQTTKAPRHEGDSGCGEDESLIQECIGVIRREQRAQVALLQRQLRLGYARAIKIMDELDRRGLVGPAKGAEPRELFLDSPKKEVQS